jgi:hypothetical protein
MRDRPQDPNEESMPAEVDRVLRALADQDPDDGVPAPADERLLAYREARLTPDETRELESLLARSAAGRRRLLELAGVDRSLPLRRVRKAVLGAVDRRRRVVPWMSAAAVAASILLALLVFFPRQHGLPAGLAYDVAARGLAESRSADAAPSPMENPVRAYPGTPLRILVRPRGNVPAGVSFALFRREGGGLRRVRQPEEARLVGDRGSAAFEGAAARVLATRAPGAYPLYVVVYTGEEPPSRMKLEPGRDPVEQLRASGRLVYPMTVILLRDEPAAEDGAR